MKKAILTLIIAAVGFTACKKDKKPADDILFGKWELAKVHGNLPEPAIIPPGSGNRYQFNRDSTYTRYIDNKVAGQGKFRINITEIRDTIKFGTINFLQPGYSEAFQFRTKTILFGSGAADGPVYEYKKTN